VDRHQLKEISRSVCLVMPHSFTVFVSLLRRHLARSHLARSFTKMTDFHGDFFMGQKKNPNNSHLSRSPSIGIVFASQDFRMAELAFQERIWAQVCFSTCLSLLHHTASTIASITDLTRYPKKVADSVTQAPKRLTGRVSLKGRSADPPQGP
jgi:hypothetical protein